MTHAMSAAMSSVRIIARSHRISPGRVSAALLLTLFTVYAFHGTASAQTGKPVDGVFNQYEVLGLNDVYLSYAGMFPRTHPIHQHLSQIQAGDKIFLAAKNPAVKICNKVGFCVGSLSQSASAKWGKKLGRVSEVRVVAMVERDSMDVQETYKGRIKAVKWEVPVLEVVYA